MTDEITWLMAFAAGLISFLSPCVLPLVPGYVSFISGVSVGDLQAASGRRRFMSAEHRRVLYQSFFFIVGFSAVFVLLGASATWVGALLAAQLSFFTKAAGLVIIFFGVLKSGFVRVPLFLKTVSLPLRTRSQGSAGALLLGSAFAFGWTPCVGPVLGGILTFAGTLNQVGFGIRLLLAYSLGLGLPFFATALGIGFFFRFFAGIKAYLGLIEKASGLVLIAMGALIYNNALTLLPAYFPFLYRFVL